MIGANQFGRMATLFKTDQRTPVPACIVMSVYFSFISPDYYDGIVLSGVNKIISRLWNFCRSACKQPIFFPDMFPLQFEDLRVGIKGLLKAPA
jgi:hypothetical protein